MHLVHILIHMMLVLNNLLESSIKSSTLSLTNSLDRFRPLFKWQWVILSRPCSRLFVRARREWSS